MNNFEESEMEPDNEEMANFRTWAVGTGKYSLTTSVRMTRTVRSLYRKLDLDNRSEVIALYDIRLKHRP